MQRLGRSYAPSPAHLPGRREVKKHGVRLAVQRVWEAVLLYVAVVHCDVLANAVAFKLLPRRVRSLLVELKGEHLAGGRHRPCQGGGQRPAARAALYDHASWPQLQLHAHHRNVCEVEDLGAVAQHQRPQLRGGRQDVQPPGARHRLHHAAKRLAYPILQA